MEKYSSQNTVHAICNIEQEIINDLYFDESNSADEKDWKKYLRCKGDRSPRVLEYLGALFIDNLHVITNHGSESTNRAYACFIVCLCLSQNITLFQYILYTFDSDDEIYVSYKGLESCLEVLYDVAPDNSHVSGIIEKLKNYSGLLNKSPLADPRSIERATVSHYFTNLMPSTLMPLKMMKMEMRKKFVGHNFWTSLFPAEIPSHVALLCTLTPPLDGKACGEWDASTYHTFADIQQQLSASEWPLSKFVFQDVVGVISGMLGITSRVHRHPPPAIADKRIRRSRTKHIHTTLLSPLPVATPTKTRPSSEGAVTATKRSMGDAAEGTPRLHQLILNPLLAATHVSAVMNQKLTQRLQEEKYTKELMRLRHSANLSTFSSGLSEAIESPSHLDSDSLNGHKLKVLLIEDSLTQRKIMCHRLATLVNGNGDGDSTDQGEDSDVVSADGNNVWFSVYYASSGEEAMDMVRLRLRSSMEECSDGSTSTSSSSSTPPPSNPPFDIIIVDQNLNGCGGTLAGHEVVLQLRNEMNLSNVVIIGCTSNAIKHGGKFLLAGADAVWAKPFPDSSIIKMELSRYLKARRMKSFRL